METCVSGVGGGRELVKQHWLLSMGSKDVRRISKTKPRSFLALPSYRCCVLFCVLLSAPIPPAFFIFIIVKIVKRMEYFFF